MQNNSHINLYVARRESRSTQAEIAKVLCIHKDTYSSKERGESVFTLPEAQMLAVHFGKTLDELFGGEGS